VAAEELQASENQKWGKENRLMRSEKQEDTIASDWSPPLDKDLVKTQEDKGTGLSWERLGSGIMSARRNERKKSVVRLPEHEHTLGAR